MPLGATDAPSSEPGHGHTKNHSAWEMTKPWESHRETMGTPWVNGGLPSGVIKDGWLENPRTEWRFKNEKIIDFYGPFSSHV